jgi:Transposase domain (DUF772)
MADWKAVMNSVDTFQEANEPSFEGAHDGTTHAAELLHLVYEANAGLSWPTPAYGSVEGVPVAVLRTLLTYCYAAGLSSSRDIEYATERDPIVRYICANHTVDADIIRRFRRDQRPWLSRGVAAVLAMAAPSGAGSYASNSACRWGQIDPFQAEADRRLKAAMRDDSLELDT